MEHRIAEKKLIEPGSIESSLSPDFDRLPPENIYKEYEMEVPEELVKFCRLIESHGGRVLLVGGCVRDAIMSAEAGKGKITPKDIDVEVYGIQPKDLLLLADQQFGLEKNPTVGNKFEIIRINSRDGSFSFDLSLPRDDNKTGSGNKGFETTSHPEFSILEGARRRDLSCNSMAYDPLTKITYDPYNGKKDVLDGVLRATDPEKFVEDPVRILRIMKFAARYGWKIEKETEELCKEMLVRGSDHELIKRLRNEKNKKVIVGGTDEETKESLELMSKSAVELDDEVKERIYKEFSKLLLESEKPSVGLEFAARVGVIDRYFPWLAEMQITEQEASWHPEGDAWKHTLQVLDAAALIMHREKMDEEDGLVFMLAALSHDLGKPTKTEKKIKNGVEVITSDGHDMEGGWMSEEFINAFAPKDKVKIVRDEKDEYLGLEETNFAKEIREKVRILTERHMQLKMLYLIHKDDLKKNEEKAEKNARKSLGRLARKLAEKGTDVFTLSFLTEADQRGRNGKSNNPLEREEVDDLEAWQSWLNEMMGKVEIKKELPKMIVDGGKIMKETGLKPGVMLGVVASWVFDDQLAGEVRDIEEGLINANKYSEIVNSCIETAKEVNWKTTSKFEKKKPPRLEDEVCSWLKEEGVKEKVMSGAEISILEKVVEINSERVARVGEWPEYIKRETLVERVPKTDGSKASGFDAGVACALGLIPENKQELAAKLHANYSEESVEQVRRETKENDPDSPSTWWLAACSVCKEGEVTAEDFIKQVSLFKELANNPEQRLATAQKEFEKMTGSFEIVNGTPFGTEDGCMQGAYLAGYKYAVMYAKQYDLYFVGTYLPSLGLENFEWSKEKDKSGKEISGPVFGSKQFVKCKDETELEAALKRIGIA